MKKKYFATVTRMSKNPKYGVYMEYFETEAYSMKHIYNILDSIYKSNEEDKVLSIDILCNGKIVYYRNSIEEWHNIK